MSNWLNATAMAFSDIYDNLVADDQEGRRWLRWCAELIAVQFDNPEIDHDLIDLTLWGWARCTLNWLDYPDDEQKGLDMVQARSDFREMCIQAIGPPPSEY
jgi:hypothetical protein